MQWRCGRAVRHERHAPRLTWDEALLIWHARDVYRVKAFCYGLLALILGADWLGATLVLGVVWGTLVVVVHACLLWGVLWLLRWGVRWMFWGLVQGVKLVCPGTSLFSKGRFLIVIVIAVLMGGCADAAYTWQRTLLQIDCRPEKLQGGQCVPVR